jgi:hypothetical protein
MFMTPIDKNELYDHLSGFLKNKGIELKAGSYSNSIQKGCSILADAINLSQKGIERAKTEIDEKLDRMRQVIHEKTAPKPTPPPNPPKAAAPKAKSRTRKAKVKRAKA